MQLLPAPIRTWCPRCLVQHVDLDEWARRPHRTHLCCACGHKWRPRDYPTVGVL